MLQKIKTYGGILLAASFGIQQMLCGMPAWAEDPVSEESAEPVVSNVQLELESTLMDDSMLLQATPEEAGALYMHLASITLTYYSESSIGTDYQMTELWRSVLDTDQDSEITLSDATTLLTISAEASIGNITVDLPFQPISTSTLPAETTLPSETTAAESTETTAETTMATKEATTTTAAPVTALTSSTTASSATTSALTTTITKTTTAAAVTTTTSKTTTAPATSTAAESTSTATITTAIGSLPTGTVKSGVDVSMYQGLVDWNQVQQNSNTEFAIIRAGYGKYASQEDPYFDLNMQNAQAAGIDCGAYWFSYALTPEAAVQEAEVFLSVIQGYQFEYPVVYDMEYWKQAQLSQAEASAIAKAFCSKMEEAGYYVSVYSYANFLNTQFSDETLALYDVWVAHFGVSQPAYSRSFYGIWQYTSSATVSGISGAVDADYAYRDYPALMKAYSLNGYSASE